MKELNIEEKAKAYDKALAVARDFYNSTEYAKSHAEVKATYEAIFPVLAESKNERIKKSLIAIITDFESLYLQENYSLSKEEALNWLEKQGEQKPADKVEHKFNVGDEIKTANEEPLTITKIDEKGYWSEDLFICGFDEECCWDLVEQKPAEWSEEDEERYESCLQKLDTGNPEQPETINSKWFKEHVYSQNTWRPSAKQIYSLDRVLCFYGKDTAVYDSVKELLEQLKKL